MSFKTLNQTKKSLQVQGWSCKILATKFFHYHRCVHRLQHEGYQPFGKQSRTYVPCSLMGFSMPQSYRKSKSKMLWIRWSKHYTIINWAYVHWFISYLKNNQGWFTWTGEFNRFKSVSSIFRNNDVNCSLWRTSCFPSFHECLRLKT